MAESKIMVIYPRPTDVDAFEKAYVDEHIPLAMEKIKGLSKFAATKVVGTPDGSTPPYLSNRGIVLPIDGGAAKVRGFRGHSGSGGSRVCDFHGRPAHHPGERRGNNNLLMRFAAPHRMRYLIRCGAYGRTILQSRETDFTLMISPSRSPIMVARM